MEKDDTFHSDQNQKTNTIKVDSTDCFANNCIIIVTPRTMGSTSATTTFSFSSLSALTLRGGGSTIGSSSIAAATVVAVGKFLPVPIVAAFLPTYLHGMARG